MIRCGLYNLVDQAAADSYLACVGSDGPLWEREQRASDWRQANPSLWKSDEQIKAEAASAPTTDPDAERKARWAYRTTTDAPKPKWMPLIDSAPADDGYDTWNFETVHPALRR